MAISAVQYHVIRQLFLEGKLPQGGRILEIGEANWYGDCDPKILLDDLPATCSTRARLVVEGRNRGEYWLFDVAKAFYEAFFSPSHVESIDFDGPHASKADLNNPQAPNSRLFDVVINHGTAEHIFNIGQVFRTMHDFAATGATMIHESPFTGWIEHGFYSLQPGLFFDLAQANDYEIVGMFIEDLHGKRVIPIKQREDIYTLAEGKRLPADSMLLTVLKKGPVDKPFQIPTQGIYAKTLPERGQKAWRELRGSLN